MKPSPSLLAAVLLFSCASFAEAQIFFSKPVTITGSVSQLLTNGSFVDAVGGNGFQDGRLTSPGAAIKIGDTTFNPIFSDSGITLSSATGIGGGSDGSGSISTPFLTVLDDVAYVGDFNSADVETGTVTLNNLKVGDLYQVQVFDDGGFTNEVKGLNTVDLSHTYTVGTFTAVGIGLTTSETFTFDSSINGIGEVNAISLRDVTPLPEPSAYAMLFGGVGMLVLVSRFRGKLA